MDVIKFYTTKDENGYMSNFYRSAITIFGKEYMTTEHYYQSMKFMDEETQEYIRTQPNPKAAANEGRRKDLNTVIPTVDYDVAWDVVKDQYMYEALVAKFLQHKDLAEKLLATGNALLIEDTTTTNDCYWGCGKDGNGLNRLGLMLMEIRGKLRHNFPLDFNFVMESKYGSNS